MTIFAELVDQRLLKTHVAGVGGKDEITAVGERDLLCPLEGQLDQIRISAWADDEVILQLPLIAVIDEVDPVVEVSVLDLGVRGHIGAPLLRIVPDEVVGLAGQLFLSFYACLGVGADEFHPEHGLLVPT